VIRVMQNENFAASEFEHFVVVSQHPGDIALEGRFDRLLELCRIEVSGRLIYEE
jgi:hypothetical protein